jgi:hypothetical protein
VVVKTSEPPHARPPALGILIYGFSLSTGLACGDCAYRNLALTIWEWVKLSLTALTISTVLVVAS